MVAENRMNKVPDASVGLFLVGPDGEQTSTLKIGEDIDRAEVDEFLDTETGAIYGGYCYEAGNSRCSFRRSDMSPQVKIPIPQQKQGL